MSQVSRECLWGMESEFGVTYFELSKPLVFYRAGAKKLKFYASLRFRRVNLEFYVNLRFCVTHDTASSDKPQPSPPHSLPMCQYENVDF